MSSIVTRTVYGSALQTMLLMGLPYAMASNTTLNEKLGIRSGEAPASGKIPALKYFAIGIGGHRFETGADSIPVVETVKHDPTDAALYKQIPFIMRPITSDLSVSDRAKYALRKTITVNSVQYYAYYLKRLDYSTVTVGMELETITNGSSSTSTFVPTSGNLNPVPITLADEGSNNLNSQYVNVRAVVDVSLSPTDCQEIINVCTLLYGDEKYAVVSELAMVSAVDTNITIDGSTNFTEVVAAQVCMFVGVFHALPYNAAGTTGTYDLGTNEPLLRLTT